MRVRRVEQFIREKFFGRISGADGHLRLPSAVELRVSPPTVNDMVREKRGITPEMAARLAKNFGTSEQFWLICRMLLRFIRSKRRFTRG
jgi:plasmid maintenance system antidote protein VapI